MKKTFIVSMLMAFAMICSCQKQDSAAEQQLARRKTQLDARETALDEREKALDDREKALDRREKTLAERDKADVAGVRGQIRDQSQVDAETDRRIQQLPPEVRALIPDRSHVNASPTPQ